MVRLLANPPPPAHPRPIVPWANLIRPPVWLHQILMTGRNNAAADGNRDGAGAGGHAEAIEAGPAAIARLKNKAETFQMAAGENCRQCLTIAHSL